MKPLALFGTGIVGKSATVTAERRLNCYYEHRIDEDKAKMVIYGTPGLVAALSIGAGPSRGIIAANGGMYSVHGNTLYFVNNALTVTAITGNLLTSGGLLEMDDSGTQLMIVDGTAGYYLSYSAPTVLNKITDPDFPNGATTVAAIDGFFIVEQPGTSFFWKSGYFDASSWLGTDNGNANIVPGVIREVDSHFGYLIIFKSASVEWWQNTGSPGFPYAQVKPATAMWGMVAASSHAHVGDTFINLFQNEQGHVQFMKANGFQLVRVSNHDVEAIINAKGFINTDPVATSWTWNGHLFYQVTFQSAGRTFLYDDIDGMWSEMQTGAAISGRHIGQFAVQFNNQIYVTDYATPSIYTFDDTAFTDNGAVIPRVVQTRHLTNGGNKFSLGQILIDMETGVGLQSGQGSDPQMMVQVSRDSGKTFNYERWVPIGKVGQYRHRVRLRRLGSAYDFVLRFRMTDPVKFVITYGSATIRAKQKAA